MTRETGKCRSCLNSGDRCPAQHGDNRENEKGEIVACVWNADGSWSGLPLVLALVGGAVMVEVNMAAWWIWAAGIALLVAVAVLWDVFGGDYVIWRRKRHGIYPGRTGCNGCGRRRD